MNVAALVRHGVDVVREFEDLTPVVTDRHQVLQILVNLIGNAKYALADAADKRLVVRIAGDGVKSVRIEVIDKGMGIAPENLTRVFQHGFTTRKDGHGFGLHSGALAAHALGGTLSVHSDGVGRGATFTLELPLHHKNGR
jgi:signal transduction histidine kinase